MKALIFGAVCAFFGLMLPAQASFINPIVTATNETVGDPSTIEVGYAFSLEGDDASLTITSVDIYFGEIASVFTPFTWPGSDPTFSTTYTYGAQGVYSISVILHGYFSTAGGSQTFFDSGNGTSVNIAGFTGVTPIPPTLLLFLTALGGLGYLGARRRKMALAEA